MPLSLLFLPVVFCLLCGLTLPLRVSPLPCPVPSPPPPTSPHLGMDVIKYSQLHPELIVLNMAESRGMKLTH